MTTEGARRRSRFLIRALEWDEARARYPNVWHKGMPVRLLAFETVASRLRLGDLLAVYSPATTRHPERSDRFVGISRVTGLQRSHEPSSAWIDLETAHRFDPPIDLGVAPRRVFLCCDPGWPQQEAGLFQRVWDVAVSQGWEPAAEETAEGAPPPPKRKPEPAVEDAGAAAAGEEAPAAEDAGAVAAETAAAAEQEAPAGPEPAAPAAPRPDRPPGRAFGGADFSGDMRDPRTGTWFAVVELRDEAIEVIRLNPTGRAGLEALLRDADASLAGVEAIGLDFPFALPIPFAEQLLAGPFPEEGWWALVRRFERMTRPEYLIALQEFKETHGELKRLTDERTSAFSPLHRVNPDLGPMTFHGIRMIGEERSRFAIRPFETAKGRLLLEVYPGGLVRKLVIDDAKSGGRRDAIATAVESLERWPVRFGAFRRTCSGSRDALDAVLAARCAAVAVLTGETDRAPDDLAPGDGARVRREGWIYGLSD